MDLKVDFAFKQLFGNEKNKKITVVFLNSILQKTGRGIIKDILFTNTEAGGEYVDDKQSRLDLLVVTDADEQIHVEIQFTNKYDMIKRSIYYWAGVYRNPLEKGMDYHTLQPVITINILNFDLFEQTDRFHTSFHLYEDEKQFKLTNVMEFHFIEMTKLIRDWQGDKLDPWNDVLARWLLMLGMVDRRQNKVYNKIYKELEEIAMKDELLYSAFESWTALSLNQKQRLAYESRLKRVMDEEAFKSSMESLQRKIEQGQQEVEQGQREIKQKQREVEQKQQELEQVQHELEQRKQQIIQEKQRMTQEKQQVEQERRQAEQGKRELEKRKQDMARRLLEKGLDIAFVIETTGLPEDEILKLQCHLK
ncbi:Rpn family recombination-promoting nuclease/putative transposase [Bacillus sp. SD088]|nr:Rpn family recombination-promoting nuclease/putative transposase [Bacillus sp. SD088]